MGKKNVTVELYDQEGAKNYSGRCVGLLDDREFNAILKSSDLQRKITTVKTISLLDVSEVKKIQDLRLVIVTKNINKTNKKGLFITEPIEMISQFTSPDDLTMVGTDGSYIVMKEELEPLVPVY